MKPKVSVIVPIYNVEQYIHRCLNSIINQTMKEIEIILIDDKSTDNSPQICDEYALKDRRIKVIHKSKNEGLGMTRNAGIEIATGKYITFCDSDDWIDQKFYEIMYHQAENENLDAVYSEFNTTYYPSFNVILKDETVYKSKKDIEELMLDIIGAEPEYKSNVKMQVSVCKVIYKAELIKKYNIKFHSERELIAEDEIFNLDFLSKAQKVKYIPIQLYYYCLNSKSLTHKYRKDLWEKQNSFFSYLNSNYQKKFTNQNEFNIRISRSILFSIRGVIEQEFIQKSTNKNIKNQLQKIFNNKNIAQILKHYPFNRMPFKHYISYNLIKYKKIQLLKLLFDIRNRNIE